MSLSIDFPVPDVQQAMDKVSIMNGKLNTHVGCMEMAKQIRDRAKAYAPVDTGHLQDSIRCWETEEGATVTAGGVSNLASPFNGPGGNFYVGYAVYQEFGTWKMRAHPYMRPAIDEVGQTPVFFRALADVLAGL